MDRAWVGQKRTAASALERASSHAAIIATTADHKEAVSAFREKRQRIYKGE